MRRNDNGSAEEAYIISKNSNEKSKKIRILYIQYFTKTRKMILRDILNKIYSICSVLTRVSKLEMRMQRKKNIKSMEDYKNYSDLPSEPDKLQKYVNRPR